MKTKTASSILLFCGVVISSCNPGATTGPGSPQFTEQSGITATMPPDDILTGTSFFAALSPTPPFTEESNNTVAEFDLSTANKVLPEDVFKEVEFYGAGGGEYCGGKYPEPTIIIDPADVELMQISTLIACGWQKNESLTGTVEFPDGRKVTKLVIAEKPENEIDFHGMLNFKPGIDDPEGRYVFSLEGKKGKVESNAYFHKPDSPRLYKLENHQLLLYNFVSFETVRLLNYHRTREFKGWKEFVTNSKGQLYVNVSGDDGDSVFIAIGTESGEVHTLFDNPFRFGRSWDLTGKISTNPKVVLQTFSLESYLLCPPSLKKLSKLQHQQNAWVIGKDDTGIELYANPRRDARVMAILPVGKELYSVYGPFCLDGEIWWSTLSAYVIERDAEGHYYVGQTQLKNSFCDGLPSRLSVGDRARVAFTDGADMRIRAKPGFAQTILEKVPEGTRFRILDGPSCTDGVIWWKVRTDDGLEGWMAEEQDGVYLLEPMQ